MGELLSVGLDVGTTTTQLIVSELTVENRGSAFSVPEMVIADRAVRYRSPVIFTPQLSGDLVDGQAIARWVSEQYAAAGIRKEQVDTGAVIITGETSRKENAREVLQALSGFAGEFVVATAGPDLESVLAAKGAGATEYSAKTGKSVLHIDIGGGTSNFAYMEAGDVVATGCLNVGGRLLTFDDGGRVTYKSPVLAGICEIKVGEKPSLSQLEELAETLTSALEMAAGLRAPTDLLTTLTTAETQNKWLCPKAEVISFSGGVADCICNVGANKASLVQREVACGRQDGGIVNPPPLRGAPFTQGGLDYRCHCEAACGRGNPHLMQEIATPVCGLVRNDANLFPYGDLGVLLGRAIGKSRLCQGVFRLGDHTVGATVMGAGCHSVQLSGSTVFYEKVTLPRKNLPVSVLKSPVTEQAVRQACREGGQTGLYLPGEKALSYAEIRQLAGVIGRGSGGEIFVCLQADMAKALGHAIALQFPDRPCLCIDRVILGAESYLDIGQPIGPALPVVAKTLILSK